ncbi:MAG: hypothetical protein IPM29_06030 [Planctomycetes bacterium]|nr:hypothetical protein [Planctomycetota bacterium]
MMRNLTLQVTPLFAAALLASPAAGQQPQLQQEPDFQSIVQDTHGVFEFEGALFAMGGGLDTTFEAGRVVITPILGKAAPHNMPLILEFDSIGRVGATAFEAGGDARPVRGVNRVDYRHGAGITERFVPRADGLKQSFLIDSPLSGSGDLVVRMDVTTELRAEVVERARELSFRALDIGFVNIGTVVGIDANGARVEGTMNFDGEHLEYTLPASFVDTAAYPIDVDPLINQTFANPGRSFGDFNMDASYDATTDTYIVTFESAPSATSSYLFFRCISGANPPQRLATQPTDTIFRRTNVFATGLKVANNNQLDQWVVVWQDNSTGDWDVRGATIDTLTQTPSAAFDISVVLGIDEVQPDVAGDSSGASQVTVVWAEGPAMTPAAPMGVAASTIDLTMLPPLPSLPTVIFSGLPCDNPAITQDGGAPQRQFVAFRANLTSIAVCALDATGTLINPPIPAAVSGSGFGLCDIAGNGNHFTVIMEELEPGSTTNNDIRTTHGVWNSGIVLIDTFIIEADQNANEREPKIVLLSSKYAACWIDPNGIFNANNVESSDIEATNLQLDSAARCGNPAFVPGDATNWMIEPGFASKLAGGAAGSDDALILNRQEAVGGGNGVLRARYYAPFAGGPITQLAGTGGCANGATIGVGSPAAIGNPNFSITLSGADPSIAIAILLLDTTRSTPIMLCGAACGDVIVPQVTVQAGVSAGAASIRLPIPCFAGLGGAGMYAQWITVGGPTAGSCVLVSGLRLSDAIEIVFGD